MKNDNETEDIRLRVTSERATLESLNQKISDPELKKQIAFAMSSLEDVEELLLKGALESTNKQLSDEELMMASASLEIAIQKRTQLEKLVRKYHSDEKKS